jgi:hypothetical protein
VPNSDVTRMRSAKDLDDDYEKQIRISSTANVVDFLKEYCDENLE